MRNIFLFNVFFFVILFEVDILDGFRFGYLFCIIFLFVFFYCFIKKFLLWVVVKAEVGVLRFLW